MVRIVMPIKTCHDCRIEKPRSEFRGLYTNASTGTQYICYKCKDCEQAQNSGEPLGPKKIYDKHPELVSLVIAYLNDGMNMKRIQSTLQANDDIQIGIASLYNYKRAGMFNHTVTAQ